jgi:RND superfamily putative drug exporter
MTGATASRAVLFSGSTFVVALLGMFLVPTTIMRSLALGAIVVGVVSVVAALTLLPAVLSLLGDRVNAWRVPYVGRNLGRADAGESRFWRRIVEAVLRRPVLYLAVSAGALLALASPIFGLHIGASGVSTLPDSLPSKQGYVALQRRSRPRTRIPCSRSRWVATHPCAAISSVSNADSPPIRASGPEPSGSRARLMPAS